MKVKNIYRSKSDFSNLSKTEGIVLGFASPLYKSETKFTERIKESSLPMHTLLNCTATITHKLKNESNPELFIDEIWDEVRPVRGKDKVDHPLAQLIGMDYDYNVNRWYEATVIFACIYVVMVLDCPDKTDCHEGIKSKCVYDQEQKNYFDHFEERLNTLKKCREANPEAYGVNPEITKEKTFSEKEWIENEKHDSWRLDRVRTIVKDKSIEEQFQTYIDELNYEKSLPNPSQVYISLLDIQIRAIQRQLSEKDGQIIKLNDVINVLNQNGFSNQRKADLLEVLSYVLYSKQYPDDICGNLERKIQLLKQADKSDDDANNKSDTKRTQKVTTDTLMLILEKAGISAALDDKAKIARLIGYLTDFSEEKIRQRLSNSDELTSYHKEEVENINKILKELNTNISIIYNKHR
jgi:hypothetical protein